jgi:hypothetical protein
MAIRAVDRFLPLLSCIRQIDDNRWTALCPAHRDRHPSLSIRQVHDRLLVRCWTGCTAAEIVVALGLTLIDLYDSSPWRTPDPIAQRRRRAAEGLEAWRQEEIRRIAEDLRRRNTIIRHIGDAADNDVVTEEEALTCLADEYRGYSELEYRFKRLLRDENVLDVWRESRRKHDQ